MIQVQLKLILRPVQERQLRRWLWHLTSVYNWTLGTIERGSERGIFYSRFDLKEKLNGHSRRLGIPRQALGGTVETAELAWRRCFQRLTRRPRRKGIRNRLNSILFDHGTPRPAMRRLHIPVLGTVRFHRVAIPDGPISQMRLVRRPSGWYACLFIKADVSPVCRLADGEVGIDPGFLSLVTLSTGEKVDHPQELSRAAVRLGQAQRGQHRALTARLLERQSNRRRDRNHKLSTRLVAENLLIAWSKDSHRSLARMFGKSVAGAAHGQLREMLRYKSRTGGTRFVEVSSRYSTVTCSACGARSGPTGYAGLSVRTWTCGCGAILDRDCNAAENTLRAARGSRVESSRETVSGIANMKQAGEDQLTLGGPAGADAMTEPLQAIREYVLVMFNCRNQEPCQYCAIVVRQIAKLLDEAEAELLPVSAQDRTIPHD